MEMILLFLVLLASNLLLAVSQVNDSLSINRLNRDLVDQSAAGDTYAAPHSLVGNDYYLQFVIPESTREFVEKLKLRCSPQCTPVEIPASDVEGISYFGNYKNEEVIIGHLTEIPYKMNILKFHALDSITVDVAVVLIMKDGAVVQSDSITFTPEAQLGFNYASSVEAVIESEYTLKVTYHIPEFFQCPPASIEISSPGTSFSQVFDVEFLRVLNLELSRNSAEPGYHRFDLQKSPQTLAIKFLNYQGAELTRLTVEAIVEVASTTQPTTATANEITRTSNKPAEKKKNVWSKIPTDLKVIVAVSAVGLFLMIGVLFTVCYLYKSRKVLKKRKTKTVVKQVVEEAKPLRINVVRASVGGVVNPETSQQQTIAWNNLNVPQVPNEAGELEPLYTAAYIDEMDEDKRESVYQTVVKDRPAVEEIYKLPYADAVYDTLGNAENANAVYQSYIKDSTEPTYQAFKNEGSLSKIKENNTNATGKRKHRLSKL